MAVAIPLQLLDAGRSLVRAGYQGVGLADRRQSNGGAKGARLVGRGRVVGLALDLLLAGLPLLSDLLELCDERKQLAS
jgi:hypothetical protein